MRAIHQDVQTLFVAGALGGLSDGQLLDRFVARQDEAAFAELVRRHGPMVMGVCRRGLGNHHDAEDAFQATFLVLARCAGAIRPRERLAAWLHGVARRVARKARAATGRRRSRERLVPAVPDIGAPARAAWDDLTRVLDQELSRLPERYRAAVVLCDLEGRGRKLAAQALGWPEGTLSSRLARGRALLARRLRRRGIGLTGGVLAALSIAQPAPAASRAASTARTAALFAAGSAVVDSAPVLSATQTTLREMLMSKLKMLAAGVTAAVALVGAGAAGLAGQGAAEDGARKAPDAPPQPAVTVQAHGSGNLRVTGDEEVITADGAVLDLGDGSKLEFVKRGEGYFGRVLPAGTDSAPVEFAFGKNGVTLMRPHRGPGVEVSQETKTLSELKAMRDALSRRLESIKRKTRFPEQDPLVRRAEDRLQHILAQIEAAPKGRIELHLMGDVAIVRPAGGARDGREAVRDPAVLQAVRDIEAALHRIERDSPDEPTRRAALDQVEASVRAHAKRRSQDAPPR